MSKKGYYMTVDVTISTGLAMLILITLLLTFGNIPRSDMVDLANYKEGESILYSLKHDGTLQQAVEYMDNGKDGKARGLIISSVSKFKMAMYPTVEIVTYDENMDDVHSFRAQKGPSVDRKYVAAIPFNPNSTSSKYGIAIIEVGT